MPNQFQITLEQARRTVVPPEERRRRYGLLYGYAPTRYHPEVQAGQYPPIADEDGVEQMPCPDAPYRLLRARFELDDAENVTFEDAIFDPTIIARYENDIQFADPMDDMEGLIPRRDVELQIQPEGDPIAGATEFIDNTQRINRRLPFDVRERVNQIIRDYTLNIPGFDATRTAFEVELSSRFLFRNFKVELEDIKLQPGDRMRACIRQRTFPHIFVRNNVPPPETIIDLRERRARQTLCRVIGKQAYASFRSKGYVHVRGKSGKTYQVFPGHQMTRVYERGERLEDLCVVLSENYAPTDNLIMRMVLILNDEVGFRKLANVHVPWRGNSVSVIMREERSLVELWNRFKQEDRS